VVGASVSGGGVQIRTSPNGDTWATVPGTQFGHQALEGLTSGNGSYLAAALTAGRQDGSGPSSSTFYTSSDAKSWTAASTRASSIGAVAVRAGARDAVTADHHSRVGRSL
jgi:hypothetical protein